MTLEQTLTEAPCYFCGYNGAGYWQSGTHGAECPWRVIGGMEERLAAVPGVMIEARAQPVSRAAAPQSERRVLARGWAVVNHHGAMLTACGESEGFARHVADAHNLGSPGYARAVYVEISEVESPPEGKESR